MTLARHWSLPTATLLGVALTALVAPFTGACEDFAGQDDLAPPCVRSDLSCTDCHGDVDTGNPAPPRDTQGNTDTSEVTVGAHQAHLGSSDWHAALQCSDCHRVPTAVGDEGHIDGGPAELTWGALASTDDASPSFDRTAASCDGVYCHGSTLLPGGSNLTPLWTVVDGSQAACGACHGLPPDPPHPQNPACANCHGMVISTYDSADPSASAWNDASRHIDGQVDVSSTACNACHGSANNPAPPVDTGGNADTALVTVGAHQMHLATSDWHRVVQCNDCHVVPTAVDDPGHLDAAPAEVTWGSLARAEGATPSFDRTAPTCDGVYCHGSTLAGAVAGGTVSRTPQWTSVDGTYDACGSTCHTNPPGGSHPANDACEVCHGNVIQSYDVADPAASTWNDASRHVDGILDIGGATCTLCHGNGSTGDPAPPVGTAGETATTDPAVGAHQAHLSGGSWHRAVQCADCHVLPSTVMHSNSQVDFSWGGPSNADGASSSYDSGALTCSGTYCHGTTLEGPNAGGTVSRTPGWTTVDGSFSECGTTCHTNPPGGSHPANDQCETCHSTVIASYNAADPASSTWADANLHVDGVVQASGYHDLGGWTAPIDGADHHGSNYFLTNAQADEHNLDCTACHGPNLDGGSSGVSCDDLSCHGRDWRSCDFCHGTFPGQNNPPAGVGSETTTDTLAVGRHVEHLGASTTHIAFACDTCHNIPATGDVSHALGYIPSADLQTEGHHGDVALSGRAAGMTWDVTATVGNPATARGSCLGACHSDGTGGSPNVTPYWAGGSWTAGACGNCHDASPNTGEHGEHVGGTFACNQCHPGQASPLHMDGSADFNGPLTYDPTGCGPNSPSCDGMCHGRDHQLDCW